MFVSFKGIESWWSLSNTIGEEPTGREVNLPFALHMTWACPDFTGSMLGTPTPLKSGGSGIGNSLFLIYVPDNGPSQKEPASYLATHKWGWIFHSEEAACQDVSGKGEGSDRARSICGECYEQVQENPFTAAKGPPKEDESNSSSFYSAILYLDNNPEMHIDAEEVASSKL